MLGLGKSDPAKDMQRKLDDARDDRAKKVARRDAAVELVGERREELQQAAAAAAPDAVLDKAEGKLAAAERRVETLQQAIDERDRDIADYQAQLATIVDGEKRSESARALDVLAADTVEVAKLIDAALEKMVEVTTRAALIVPEAAGVVIYGQGARNELPAAFELIVSVLRGRCRGVLAGHGPAELPKPPAALPPPIAVAQPQSAGVFTTKPIKWLDDRGHLRTHPAWFDCTLPVELAARAVELGAAVDMRHKIAKSSRGGHYFVHPDPSKCVALNDTGEPAPAEAAPGDAGANGANPPAAAQFTPIDRGKPYLITTQGTAR